jgi:urease accessory protein
MITASKRVPAGRGLAAPLLRRATHVSLDWDVRCKSRFDCTDSSGRALGVFLPRGTVLRGGDVLVAEDGSLVRVDAAPQPVLVVRAPAGNDRLVLLRAAYHLGNRHVTLELQPDHLKLEPDHVLAELLRAMGLHVEARESAFEPEPGAYAAPGHAHGTAPPDHGHGHHHGQGHHHDHDHDHGPRGHGHGDAHDPGTGSS